MTHFHYLSRKPTQDDEDFAQEAWCKALAKTQHRPEAVTVDELIHNYQHIAGLVTHIFNQEKINDRRTRKRRRQVPLTDDIGMVYNREDALGDCTPEQLDAIAYFVSVIEQDRPLTLQERVKLSRLRKTTGLALSVPRHTCDSESH